MISKKIQTQKATEEKSKKYMAPKLSVYGSMTQLTASGLSNGSENDKQPSHIKP